MTDIQASVPQDEETDRYHVQVLIKEGKTEEWRFVRPTNGDPYVFSKAEADHYVETYTTQYGQPGRYRTYKLPANERNALLPGNPLFTPKFRRALYQCKDCGNKIVTDPNHTGSFWPVCKGRCRQIINPHTAREVVLRKQTTHVFLRDLIDDDKIG